MYIVAVQENMISRAKTFFSETVQPRVCASEAGSTTAVNHLELGNHLGTLFGETLPLRARLAVGDAKDLHDRALLLAGVAVTHGVIPCREDGSLINRAEADEKKGVGNTHTHTQAAPEAIKTASKKGCYRELLLLAGVVAVTPSAVT